MPHDSEQKTPAADSGLSRPVLWRESVPIAAITSDGIGILPNGAYPKVVDQGERSVARAYSPRGGMLTESSAPDRFGLTRVIFPPIVSTSVRTPARPRPSPGTAAFASPFS